MAEDVPCEDYPTEIDEYLTGFDTSLGSVNDVVQKLLTIGRSDQKVRLNKMVLRKLEAV